MRTLFQVWMPIFLVCLVAATANGQSFMVQCPTSTLTHPTAADNNSEPAYTSATAVNGAIKCQQIRAAMVSPTMGDGSQTYMFSFGPLSGLAKMAAGQPGTDFPNEFNVVAPVTLKPGDPATADGPIPPPTASSRISLLLGSTLTTTALWDSLLIQIAAAFSMDTSTPAPSWTSAS